MDPETLVAVFSYTTFVFVTLFISQIGRTRAARIEAKDREDIARFWQDQTRFETANRQALERAAYTPHLNHGHGTSEDGPDDKDCLCRGTNYQTILCNVWLRLL